MANFYISSGTSFSAIINITYPAGSACTVSNYKKTWTDSGTTGSWSCKVNEAAYYTIKITSGSRSKTEGIWITTNGQVETLTINYEIVLWENGQGYNENLTGGFSLYNSSGDSSVGISSSGVTLYGNRTYYGSGSDEWSYSSGFYTTIKVTNNSYSKFCVNLTKNSAATPSSATGNKVWLYAASTGKFSGTSTLARTEIPTTTSEIGTFSVSISSVTSAVLGLRVYGASNAHTVIANKFWLEY